MFRSHQTDTDVSISSMMSSFLLSTRPCCEWPINQAPPTLPYWAVIMQLGLPHLEFASRVLAVLFVLLWLTGSCWSFVDRRVVISQLARQTLIDWPVDKKWQSLTPLNSMECYLCLRWHVWRQHWDLWVTGSWQFHSSLGGVVLCRWPQLSQGTSFNLACDYRRLRSLVKWRAVLGTFIHALLCCTGIVVSAPYHSRLFCYVSTVLFVVHFCQHCNFSCVLGWTLAFIFR